MSSDIGQRVKHLQSRPPLIEDVQFTTDEVALIAESVDPILAQYRIRIEAESPEQYLLQLEQVLLQTPELLSEAGFLAHTIGGAAAGFAGSGFNPLGAVAGALGGAGYYGAKKLVGAGWNAAGKVGSSFTAGVSDAAGHAGYNLLAKHTGLDLRGVAPKNASVTAPNVAPAVAAVAAPAIAPAASVPATPVAPKTFSQQQAASQAAATGAEPAPVVANTAATIPAATTATQPPATATGVASAPDTAAATSKSEEPLLLTKIKNSTTPSAPAAEPKASSAVASKPAATQKSKPQAGMVTRITGALQTGYKQGAQSTPAPTGPHPATQQVVRNVAAAATVGRKRPQPIPAEARAQKAAPPKGSPPSVIIPGRNAPRPTRTVKEKPVGAQPRSSYLQAMHGKKPIPRSKP